MTMHEMMAMDPNTPNVGDRVRIVRPHMPEHEDAEATVRQVVGHALGVELDAMPGKIHQWYLPSEVIVTKMAPMDSGETMDAKDRKPTISGAHYPRVASLFYGHPWALSESKYEEIRQVMEARRAGVRFTDEEIRFRVGARTAPRPDYGIYDAESDVLAWAREDGAFRAADGATVPAGRQVLAIVGIYGTIVPRGSAMAETSGLTSTERLSARVRAAVADPAVKGILLDMDTPGGQVAGGMEFAAELRAAREAKPLWAVANYQALSLGYWFASQASQIIASPSSLLGSIGVLAEHEDRSAEGEKMGVQRKVFRYGKNKALVNDAEPLSDDAAEEIQKHVDAFGRAFETDVAKGRGISVDVVRSQFGQGLVFGAKEAVERGLADSVGTLDDTMRRMMRKRMPDGKGQAERAAAEARMRIL